MATQRVTITYLNGTVSTRDDMTPEQIMVLLNPTDSQSLKISDIKIEILSNQIAA